MWGQTFRFAQSGGFPLLETLLLVGASALAGRSRAQLMASNALGLAFVVVKFVGDAEMIQRGLTPASSLMLGCWFALTTVHALHVLAGAVASGWLAGPGFAMATDDADRWAARIQATQRYWLFVDLVWIAIIVSFYLA